tara:strand:- start:3177 stop:4049 length:873 start_codon:yes stop_codon:yes gene_type:complete
MKKYYIIIPTYNDWKSLNKLLGVLNINFKNSKTTINILIVNDGSIEKFKLDIRKLKFLKKITLINLKKNSGNQKAIFIGLKYLQKKIKKINSKDIISILDSDGEDNPNKLIRLIRLADQKKDFFVFARRLKRTENIFLKILNVTRLMINSVLIGKSINFGNFSSFSLKNLNNLLINDNLHLAYSSGVLKNNKNILFLDIDKKKRYFGNSKVNFLFLINHSIKIISVFYKKVFLRTFFLLILFFLFFKNIYLNFIFSAFFILINITLFSYNKFNQPKKGVLQSIKTVNIIK